MKKSFTINRFSEENRPMMILGILCGIIYIAAGLLEAVSAVFPKITEIASLLFINGDLFTAFILIVIGAVFIRGMFCIRMNTLEGNTFFCVGFILSLVFFVIALAGALAAGLDMFIQGKDALAGIISKINPLLYLGVFGLAGYAAWAKVLLKEVISG